MKFNLLIILCGLCFGCKAQKNQIVEKIDLLNGSPLLVKLEKDADNNLFISLFDNQNYLYEASGIGNSEVILKDKTHFLNPCEFIKNGLTEYYIETYDISSSYGANCIFIIWFDGYYWRITKSPFEKSIIKDTNKDKLFEIVSSGKKKGIMRFDNQQFIVTK